MTAGLRVWPWGLKLACRLVSLNQDGVLRLACRPRFQCNKAILALAHWLQICLKTGINFWPNHHQSYEMRFGSRRESIFCCPYMSPMSSKLSDHWWQSFLVLVCWPSSKEFWIWYNPNCSCPWTILVQWSAQDGLLDSAPHKQIHRKMQEAKCFTAGYLKQRDKERTKGAGAQQGWVTVLLNDVRLACWPLSGYW